jgi:hypothetical protein
LGKAVFILGKSGNGKSTSLRNIPDNTYSVVEVCGKPLPFRTKKKALNTDDYTKISGFMAKTPADIIVIDDSQYLMANEFMRRAKEKGFEKFTDIGLNFWNLINEVSKLPENKIVYFLHHVEDDGQGGMKEKTIGKMLDEKICIAGMFSIVLYADKSDKEYFFATQNDGKNPAKTPMGMFEARHIDNDLLVVDQAIRAYYEMPAPTVIEAPEAAK